MHDNHGRSLTQKIPEQESRSVGGKRVRLCTSLLVLPLLPARLQGNNPDQSRKKEQRRISASTQAEQGQLICFPRNVPVPSPTPRTPFPFPQGICVRGRVLISSLQTASNGNCTQIQKQERQCGKRWTLPFQHTAGFKAKICLLRVGHRGIKSWIWILLGGARNPPLCSNGPQKGSSRTV